MNRIARIEQSLHQLTLDSQFPVSWDRHPRQEFQVAVYRAFDDEGRMGIGAGHPWWGLGDRLELFVGQDPLDLARHSAVLDNLSFLEGRPWPLEIALWDLAGKIRNEPLWRMVGGTGDRVRPYASSGTHWTLGEVEERVDRALEAGFGALKLRFGRRSLDQDIEIVSAVRERVGDQIGLIVDCGQGWRAPSDVAPPWTCDHAVSVAHRLEEYGVAWIEEPLHRADYEGMTRLRRETSIRVGGAGMTREWYELENLLERRCLDVYQPDAALTGGIERLRHFAAEVRGAGFAFSPRVWGSGVSLVANAHLAAGTVAAPDLEYPFDPPEWTPASRDFMLSHPVEPDGEGWLTLGEAPGLGVDLDEERLAFTRIRSVTV